MKTLFTDFGKPEGDPGEFFPLGTDADGAPCELRVRRIPDSVGTRFEKKYGREEQVARPGGGKRAQRVYSLDELQSVLSDKAEWAWTEARNIPIGIGDDDAAAFYTQQLGRPVQAGDTLKLEGPINDTIKRRLFAQDNGLPGWILQRSAKLDLQYREVETDLSKV